MKKYILEFTAEELGALTSLAADQLFRKQFIDPKMPGFAPNHEELDLCKNVVGRLRAVMDANRPKTADLAPKKRVAAGR